MVSQGEGEGEKIEISPLSGKGEGLKLFSGAESDSEKLSASLSELMVL
jgi:hypothetical protein